MTDQQKPASVSGEVVVVQRSVLQRAERLLDGVGQRGKLLDDIRQLLAAVPEAACDACPWPVAAHNQGVCPPGSPAPEAATDKAPSAVGGVDRMREARIRRVYEQVEGELADISDRLEDEGDRVYLGSTNDAEALRELAHKATRLLQDMDYEDSPA